MALGISLIDSGENFLKVKPTGYSTSVTGFNWYLNNAYDGYSSRGNPIYEFSGLRPDTTYTVKVAFLDANGDKLDIIQKNFSTEAAFLPPTITISNLTSTESSVGISADIEINGSGKYYVIFSINYLGLNKEHSSSPFSTSRTLYWSFDGIPSNTLVSVTVSVLDYNTDTEYDSASKRIYTKGPVRPNNWNWSSNVRKNSPIKYTRNGNVVTCYPLTANEWNLFIDRIVEFREYLELPASDLSSLKVRKGNTFSAEKPEAARQIINAMNPLILDNFPIIKGEYITADDINRLKDSLNSIQ